MPRFATAAGLLLATASLGSRNHLRSFVRQLSAAGESYVPRFIDPATYLSIVTTPMERGR